MRRGLDLFGEKLIRLFVGEDESAAAYRAKPGSTVSPLMIIRFG